jgi:hypothetical protein
VHIDPLGDFDAQGSTNIPAEDATYSIVATADGGAASEPFALEIHTHPPGDPVSQHLEVGPDAAGGFSDFEIVIDDGGS